MSCVHDEVGNPNSIKVHTPFVRLSCELEGHPLGGGVLKLEPREAGRIVLPPPATASVLSGPEVAEAVSTMRTWRHYDGG